MQVDGTADDEGSMDEEENSLLLKAGDEGRVEEEEEEALGDQGSRLGVEVVDTKMDGAVALPEVDLQVGSGCGRCDGSTDVMGDTDQGPDLKPVGESEADAQDTKKSSTGRGSIKADALIEGDMGERVTLAAEGEGATIASYAEGAARQKDEDLSVQEYVKHRGVTCLDLEEKGCSTVADKEQGKVEEIVEGPERLVSAGGASSGREQVDQATLPMVTRDVSSSVADGKGCEATAKGFSDVVNMTDASAGEELPGGGNSNEARQGQEGYEAAVDVEMTDFCQSPEETTRQEGLGECRAAEERRGVLAAPVQRNTVERGPIVHHDDNLAITTATKAAEDLEGKGKSDERQDLEEEKKDLGARTGVVALEKRPDETKDDSKSLAGGQSSDLAKREKHEQDLGDMMITCDMSTLPLEAFRNLHHPNEVESVSHPVIHQKETSRPQAGHGRGTLPIHVNEIARPQEQGLEGRGHHHDIFPPHHARADGLHVQNKQPARAPTPPTHQQHGSKSKSRTSRWEKKWYEKMERNLWRRDEVERLPSAIHVEDEGRVGGPPLAHMLSEESDGGIAFDGGARHSMTDWDRSQRELVKVFEISIADPYNTAIPIPTPDQQHHQRRRSSLSPDTATKRPSKSKSSTGGREDLELDVEESNVSGRKVSQINSMQFSH